MNRVKIGANFDKQPQWKIFIGVPLIYLPIIVMIPFVALGVFIVRIHLYFMGGQNIKSYWDFVPAWASHRYSLQNQITYTTGAAWYNLRAHKLYWIFNCKLYCPLSVALFRYCAYLVKLVENWWCPFDHGMKHEYEEGSIDKSYWHLHEQERRRLHPDDRENITWNEGAGKKIDKPE